MWRALVGRVQLYVFLLRYHLTFWVSAFATVAGVAAIVLSLVVPSFRSSATLASSLGLLATLIGVALFIRDVRELSRVQNDLYLERRSMTSADGSLTLQLSDTYTFSSYKTVTFRDQTAIYSPAVNTLLRERIIPYHLDRQRFRMTSATWFVAPLALKMAFMSAAYIFNNPKVRLRYDLTEQAILSGRIADLQRTDYFTELCTNAMVEWQVFSKSDHALRFNGVELMANNETILNLEDTGNGCANLIGISTMAFTRDGYLIVPVQGAHTQKSPGHLAPSGSGSADLADVEGERGSLQAFITRATERELREECGISASKYTIRTELVGFCRVLQRGGLPEFFSVSFIDADHAALHVPKSESAYIAQIDPKRINRESAGTLLDEVRKYRVSRHAQGFSLQLYLNLLFLEDYLESAPASFARLAASPTHSSDL